MGADQALSEQGNPFAAGIDTNTVGLSGHPPPCFTRRTEMKSASQRSLRSASARADRGGQAK